MLMAAGDTFRAAAGEQLEVWAQRTGSEIVMPEAAKARPAAGTTLNVKRLMCMRQISFKFLTD